MSICILRYQETLASSRTSVLGVYSSPLKAWQIFQDRVKQRRAPYTTGQMQHMDAVSFQLAFQLREPQSTAIKIYYDQMFEVLIVWNVLDKALP